MPFARRAAALTGLPDHEALRCYTTFYEVAVDDDAGSPPSRWQFDPDHPRWRELVDAVEAGADPVDVVYDAYRRLFPDAYVRGLHSAGQLHQFAALWGQFLDRFGVVKPHLRDEFLSRVSDATSMQELNACFPHDVLATSCHVRHFYRHYGITEVSRAGP